MKIRSDFVTNSSSSCFVLSKESLERGLEKYHYPAAADMLAAEGRPTVELLYRLLHEIHSDFCGICLKVIAGLGITREQLEQEKRQLIESSRRFYRGMEPEDEWASVQFATSALDRLIEDTAAERTGKRFNSDELDRLFGVKTYMLNRLFMKLWLFERYWKDCGSYREFLQRAAEQGEDGELEGLEMLLLDHTGYSMEDLRPEDCRGQSFEAGKTDSAMYWFLCQDKEQRRCRFGKQGIEDCRKCPDISPLCIGEVGLYSWDCNFPLEITDRLMEFCEFGSNHF